MVSSEVLAVLADEVTEAEAVMRESIERVAAAADETAFQEAAEPYLQQLERLTAVCGALELVGLQEACAFVTRNFQQLTVGSVDAGRCAVFEQWPHLVLGYLRAPLDGVYSRELAEWFWRPEWPSPLDIASANSLALALTTFPEAGLGDTDNEPSRETQASAEDVVLEIPHDVHHKLVDAFLSEGPQQANDYSVLIQRIVRGDGWSEELNECRRLVHALKGSANTVGTRGVAVLCHHAEDILEYLAKNSLLPTGALATLLVKVADTLEVMFEALLGIGEPPADAQEVLQRLLDMANRIDRGEYETAIASDEPGLQPASVSPSEEMAAVKSVARSEKVEPKVRVDVRVVDNMLRVSGEQTISCGHVLERMQQAFKLVAELRERQAALWSRSNDMEGFVATQGIAAGRRQALAAAADAPSEFDPLELDQYSELHTYVHGLAETVADLQILGTRLIDGLTTMEATIRQQASLNSEMHDLLMTSRMAPASHLESRLQRAVRQAGEQCGKLVTLRVTGTDVMLDDQLINTLIDPLQHLLRNAVDHGIEAPNVRTERGKPETGEIVLSFMRDGKYLVITCRDDGAGLDLARIYQHATERGLVRENQVLADEEIARLILRPGFSTAETVTQVSGRGVGLDIVHTHIAKLKGSIDIRTQSGQGAMFTMRVPLSLGIIHCLLVVVGNETFALPSDNLEQIVYEGSRNVQRVDGEWRYRDGDVDCQVQFLARLTGATARAEIVDARPQHVVFVHDVNGKIGIVVDGVRGGQDLVIKKPGRYLSSVHGLVGASILGDGSLVPILELLDLLQIDRTDQTARHAVTAAMTSVADVLIVDDSLSVRTALSILLSDEGFRVRTAKDGVEAIEAINQRRPELVLADLEMPRMNGLELTAHIRANSALRDLPVVMITSRTAEKHRKQAAAVGVNDYVTKPYRDADLVERLRTMLSNAPRIEVQASTG